ncbi:hypothetical protein DFH08DRAFT_796706 [Mycena albidolilacea]|uniref:Uncharacterized protein n=1 Tax=Mycena albidolilacea TaxID=1033008 RepID=A0AAD7F798_9AGAR|nr:hypothetical protein DFH08DRAFT_796706 [Mycena albidolilacea]
MLGYRDTLANPRRDYTIPPFCARGTFLRPSSRVESARSRLLQPTKASAARSHLRSSEETGDNSKLVESASRSVSRSISPDKESRAGLSSETFVSPAASHTRNAARVGKTLTFLSLPAATRAPHSKISNIAPLEPITTKETAHAPSPHHQSFSVVDPNLKPIDSFTIPSSSSPLPSLDMATHVESIRSMAPGMERGYALLPMAELERDYASHSESEASLFERATSIASKRTLDPTDILDRGDQKTVKDVNFLLSRASALVPGRSTFFIVDPQHSFLRVLKSAGDLNQLTVAWQALSVRMGLAQRSFVKYQEEFRATTKEDMPHSPVSTAPEVYAAFPVDRSPIADVNYLYQNVPHLRDVWPAGYTPGETRIESVVEVPTYLSQAFPDRVPEERPTTYYYAEDGTRMAVAASVRSSHGAGPNFVPPPPDVAGHSRRSHLRAVSASPTRGWKEVRSPAPKDKHKDGGADPRATENASTAAPSWGVRPVGAAAKTQKAQEAAFRCACGFLSVTVIGEEDVHSPDVYGTWDIYDAVKRGASTIEIASLSQGAADSMQAIPKGWKRPASEERNLRNA